MCQDDPAGQAGQSRTLRLPCSQHAASSGSTTAATPCARSAHCLVDRWPGSVASPRGLLLFGGDTGAVCNRLADVWLLDLDAAARLGNPAAAWRQLQPEGTPPEPRSNCCAVVAGDRLIVFGGWNWTGTRALAGLAVLDLRAPRWLDLPIGGRQPCARGQPAAVLTSDGARMLLFGGWDGRQRFSDLHQLDLQTWTWSEVALASGVRPPARADHTCALWRYCDDGAWKDLIVCFGGSTAGGPANDVWLCDLRWRKWTQAFCAGRPPAPRSSHAAALVGSLLVVAGGQARGQVFGDCHLLQLDSLTWVAVDLGPSPPPPLCRSALAVSDGILWGFGGFDGRACTDLTFCVHLGPAVSPAAAVAVKAAKAADAAAAAMAASVVVAPGGQATEADGAHLVATACACSPASSCHCADSLAATNGNRSGAVTVSLHPADSNGCISPARESADGTSTPPAASSGCSIPRFSSVGAASGKDDVTGEAALPPVALPEVLWRRKDAPLTVDDLPDADEARLLPRHRLTRRLHQEAVRHGRTTYIDPESGYTVFTSLYLKRRPCCGNKCRHCPHGWKNVAKWRKSGGSAPDTGQPLEDVEDLAGRAGSRADSRASSRAGSGSSSREGSPGAGRASPGGGQGLRKLAGSLLGSPAPKLAPAPGRAGPASEAAGAAAAAGDSTQGPSGCIIA